MTDVSPSEAQNGVQIEDFAKNLVNNGLIKPGHMERALTALSLATDGEEAVPQHCETVENGECSTGNSVSHKNQKHTTGNETNGAEMDMNDDPVSASGKRSKPLLPRNWKQAAAMHENKQSTRLKLSRKPSKRPNSTGSVNMGADGFGLDDKDDDRPNSSSSNRDEANGGRVVESEALRKRRQNRENRSNDRLGLGVSQRNRERNLITGLGRRGTMGRSKSPPMRASSPSTKRSAKSPPGLGKIKGGSWGKSSRDTGAGMVREGPGPSVKTITAAASGSRGRDGVALKRASSMNAGGPKVLHRGDSMGPPVAFNREKSMSIVSNSIALLSVEEGDEDHYKSHKGGKNTKVSPRLHRKGGEQANQMGEKLRDALFLGDVGYVRYLIDREAHDVNWVDPVHKVGLLHICAFKNMHLMANLLISRAADVNQCNNHAESPLHWAAAMNSTSTAQLLLDFGANVELIDISGNTPLFRAIEGAHVEMVVMLLNRGANLMYKHPEGTTAVDLISKLLSEGIPPQNEASSGPLGDDDKVDGRVTTAIILQRHFAKLVRDKEAWVAKMNDDADTNDTEGNEAIIQQDEKAVIGIMKQLKDALGAHLNTANIVELDSKFPLSPKMNAQARGGSILEAFELTKLNQALADHSSRNNSRHTSPVRSSLKSSSVVANVDIQLDHVEQEHEDMLSSHKINKKDIEHAVVQQSSKATGLHIPLPHTEDKSLSDVDKGDSIANETNDNVKMDKEIDIDAERNLMLGISVKGKKSTKGGNADADENYDMDADFEQQIDMFEESAKSHQGNEDDTKEGEQDAAQRQENIKSSDLINGTENGDGSSSPKELTVHDIMALESHKKDLEHKHGSSMKTSASAPVLATSSSEGSASVNSGNKGITTSYDDGDVLEDAESLKMMKRYESARSVSEQAAASRQRIPVRFNPAEVLPFLPQPGPDTGGAREGDVIICVEQCFKCEDHQWSLWHDAAKYNTMADRCLIGLVRAVMDGVVANHGRPLPVRLFACKAVPKTGRLGALEVTMAFRNQNSWTSTTLFSKLNSSQWPNVKRVVHRAVGFLQWVQRSNAEDSVMKPTIALEEGDDKILRTYNEKQFMEWLLRLTKSASISTKALHASVDVASGKNRDRSQRTMLTEEAMANMIADKGAFFDPALFTDSSTNYSSNLSQEAYERLVLDHFFVFDSLNIDINTLKNDNEEIEASLKALQNVTKTSATATDVKSKSPKKKKKKKKVVMMVEGDGGDKDGKEYRKSGGVSFKTSDDNDKKDDTSIKSPVTAAAANAAIMQSVQSDVVPLLDIMVNPELGDNPIKQEKKELTSTTDAERSSNQSPDTVNKKIGKDGKDSPTAIEHADPKPISVSGGRRSPDKKYDASPDHSPTRIYRVGARVEGNYRLTNIWYRGQIMKVLNDGVAPLRYVVEYDDDEIETLLPPAVREVVAGQMAPSPLITSFPVDTNVHDSVNTVGTTDSEPISPSGATKPLASNIGADNKNIATPAAEAIDLADRLSPVSQAGEEGSEVFLQLSASDN